MTAPRSVRWLSAVTLFLALGAVARSQPPAERKPNPPLRVVPIDLDLSDPKKPVDPVVFFEPADSDGDAPAGAVTGLLRRELYRQALLITARDEFGLTTRDGALREVPPADLPANNRLRINPRLTRTEPHEVKIEVGPAAASRVIWTARAAGPPAGPEDPMHALVTAESFSRDEYVTALERAGLPGKPNRVNSKSAAPAEAEKLLRQMTFTAQFAAARLLHEAIRTNGESAATLGPLSRAYANLGMLTETQFGAFPWVFKARGLLYAQRLRLHDPAAGLWHRAYAAALAGLHRDALADVEAAAEARKGSAPAWAAPIDAFCRFDSAALKELSRTGANADLARVLHFLTVENRSVPLPMLTAGAEVLKKIPECYRVHDALAESGGVASMHTSTLSGLTVQSKTFAERVAGMPGLPKGVGDAVAREAEEPELVTALVEAGLSREDRGEPSWAVLGRLGQEARAVQVCGRLTFLRRVLSAPADEFFAAAKPLVADHPLFPLLEALASDRAFTPAEHAKRLRAVKVPELTYRHAALMHGIPGYGEDDWTRFSRVAVQHGDDLYYDLYLRIRNYAPIRNSLDVGRPMLARSPHSPIARASVITFDEELAAAQLTAWEKEAQHPEVYLALAQRAINEYSPADAEAPLLKAIELSPDRAAYQLLASVYLKTGTRDKWVATLEQVLKQPDPGLDHAQIRYQIAHYYMSLRDFKKAQPYAEAAAETWAGWAMQCAMQCAEGLEEWDRAEQWARRVSERYTESPHEWYFWCLRHQRGDLAAAQELVENHLKRIGEPRTQSDIVLAGMYNATAGQPKKAAEYFVSAYGTGQRGIPAPPPDGLLIAAALEYDALGDTAARDKALGQIGRRNNYGVTLTVIRDALKRGEKEVPKPEELKAAVNRLEYPPARADFYYFVGRFLQTRGEHQLAGEYLRQSAAETRPGFALAPPLAGIALRELEKKK